MCSILPSGCRLLKSGVQRPMDNIEILFEKTVIPVVRNEDVAIITISANPSKVSLRKPIRITSVPRIAPLIIIVPGPIPYTSDKVVPWNYGVDVYYHGIKQELKNEEADTNVSNIVGASKVTRSGRLFSSEISPPTLSINLLSFHLPMHQLLSQFLFQLSPMSPSHLGLGAKKS